MKMKKEEFDAKLNEYMSAKFIPALSSLSAKFVLGAMAGAKAFRLDLAGGGALGMLGVLGPDGTVDVDALKRAVYGGFDAAKDGYPVNRFGLGNIERSDADAFFAWLEPPPAKPAA